MKENYCYVLVSIINSYEVFCAAFASVESALNNVESRAKMADSQINEGYYNRQRSLQRITFGGFDSFHIDGLGAYEIKQEKLR